MVRLAVRRRPTGAPASARARWMGASWMVAAGCSVISLGVVAARSTDAAADREQEVAAVADPAPGALTAAPEAARTNTKPRSSEAATDSAASATTAGGTTDTTATSGVPADGGTTSASTDSGDSTDPGAEEAGRDGAGTATDAASPAAKTVQPGGNADGSQCSDPTGEATTESLGDMDLTAVELSRDSEGLRVRFRLNGPVPADAGLVAGSPATNLWQLLLASGDEVLYAFSVTEHGTVWETSLVDFASASGDRLGTISAQSGPTVEAVIPNAQLSRLPASFTWWALTNTDRQVPTGPYIGDDCPNGTGDLDPTQLLPPESSRAAFSG